MRDLYLAFGSNRSLVLQGKKPYMALDVSMVQDLTMALGGSANHLHLAVPHYRWLSSSTSLYPAPMLLFLFLVHLVTPYLLMCWCLWSVGFWDDLRRGLRIVLALPMSCGTLQGSSQTCFLPGPCGAKLWRQ